MKKIFCIFYFALTALFYSYALAQNERTAPHSDTTRNRAHRTVIWSSKDTAETTDAHDLITFKNAWKIKTGDDSSYASVNYDDSIWRELNDTAGDNTNYNGITWYRMHFTVDTQLLNVPLAFYFRQFGSASEVYLDGKLLQKYGVVGKDKATEKAEFSTNPPPFALVFSGKNEHLLAIRFSNFHRSGLNENGFNLGENFKISFHHLNPEIADAADPSQYFPLIFFGAIFLTLSILHFIMFIFYRQKIVNLYYSLYCLGIFLVSIFIYLLITSTDYRFITVMSSAAKYLSPLLIIPLVAMLHTIFYDRLLRIFKLIILVYAVSIIVAAFNYNKILTFIVLILFMVATVEIIRVIIKSLARQKDGAWVFSMVLLLPVIVGIICSNLPDEFILSDVKIPINTGAIVSCSFILSLPFAMTIYLARDFARMGKKLKLQLEEITSLSTKTLQQEKEKKQILENQKTELEQKVTERTHEVLHQKEVIEIKNKEITASLVYAKRIQSAILPDIKLIYKTLQQSFILYLPKDIVSGDFYGFAQKNNKVIIAAADCTGHGVAGAFMSMIGSALFNQIINEKNITSPALILDELNEGIIIALKQRESESNEGMDIAVCAFDLEKNTVEFAGANRPLWLVRKNELKVYRPDKLPIGGLQIERRGKFSLHEISLQQNDSVYLFSDGYADQFGGERGKKLMTKKFRETLLSIQNMSMHDQEIYLRKLFENWRGNNEQVDDVLVIGIRV